MHASEDESLNARAPLPRGRHALPADEVMRRQRERVAMAVVEVLAEVGYGSTTVERLHKQAGISRSTFYEHFGDKRDAVLASYDLYFDRFCGELTERCVGEDDRVQRVRAAVAAACRIAVEEPARAQFLFGFPLGADPVLATHVFESQERLAEMLGPAEGDPQEPTLVLKALLIAATQVLTRHLVTSEEESIPELEAILVEVILGPSNGRTAKGST